MLELGRMRIWEPFLTAGDKASLRSRPHQVWGFGQRPALVLIDLYRWVFGDRRQTHEEAVAEWPGTCGIAAWDALPHIERLLAAARAARIPIVHVTGLDPHESGVANWTDTPDGGESVIYTAHPLDPDHLRRRFQIVDEVAPRPGEAIIRKNAPSAFFGTLLLAHLHGLAADAVILCGESTSGCVRATCVDARSNRFKVTVAEECVFDRHETPHAMNLFDMHQKYADVLGVDEIVTHLRSLEAHRTVARN